MLKCFFKPSLITEFTQKHLTVVQWYHLLLASYRILRIQMRTTIKFGPCCVLKGRGINAHTKHTTHTIILTDVIYNANLLLGSLLLFFFSFSRIYTPLTSHESDIFYLLNFALVNVKYGLQGILGHPPSRDARGGGHTPPRFWQIT